jgi:hypothetical protein
MNRLLRILIMIFILSSACLPAWGQDFRTIPQTAFKRGEVLQYKVFWDAWMLPKMTAGIATVTIADENKKFSNRNTFHVIGTGISKGLLNVFYKVNDRYETYIDEEAVIPWLFIRKTKEGSYVSNDMVAFKPGQKIAINRHGTRPVPDNVQDIISAFYYARTLDFSNAHAGDIFPFDFYLDDSVYVSEVVYEGRDTISIDMGTFSCLKFKPMVLVGEVFKEPYPMTLWVTDDKNHIPIMAQSAVIVGRVKMELILCEGLSNPLTSKIR